MAPAIDWQWDFLCGSISGVANCLSGYIFDTLKVKLQMNPSMTMTKYLLQLRRENKLTSLFDGMYYPLTTVPLVNAVVFGSYEFYKKIFKKQELSFIDGMQNGAFAGLVNTIVVSPVELIKCRMQLDDKKVILREEGVRGIFQGMVATAMREIPCYAAQFATYEILKNNFTSPENPHMSFVQSLLVGGLAGTNCWVFSYPQDIIKTKLQVSPGGTYPRNSFLPDGGIISCARHIYAENRLKGFWFGITPCLIRAFVANSFGIAVYEETQQVLSYFKRQH